MTTFIGTLTATDGSGQTATATVNVSSVVVTPPPVLTVSVGVSPQSGPPGTTFTITANAHGGVPPYTYSVSPAMTSSAPGVWTTQTAGTAQVTVRDAAGASAVGSVTFSNTAIGNRATIRVVGFVASRGEPLAPYLSINDPIEHYYTFDLNAISQTGDVESAYYPTGLVSAFGRIGAWDFNFNGDGNLTLGFMAKPPGPSPAPVDCDLIYAVTNHKPTCTIPNSNVFSGCFQMRQYELTALLSPKGNIAFNMPQICDVSRWSPEGMLRKVNYIFQNPPACEFIGATTAITRTA